jgi:two-component system, chemotaxis family, response regulator Rcp1
MDHRLVAVHKNKILMVYLVDDDIDDLQIVREALLQYSYKGNVKTAVNGQVLMDDLSQSDGTPNPQVIILDLNMPLKNGFEVLREIKDNPSLNRIPVVVLTASSNEYDEIKCLELGCSYFFRKPFSIDEYKPIVNVVKKILVNQPI